jgi:hypothetical protein
MGRLYWWCPWCRNAVWNGWCDEPPAALLEDCVVDFLGAPGTLMFSRYRHARAVRIDLVHAQTQETLAMVTDPVLTRKLPRGDTLVHVRPDRALIAALQTAGVLGEGSDDHYYVLLRRPAAFR